MSRRRYQRRHGEIVTTLAGPLIEEFLRQVKVAGPDVAARMCEVAPGAASQRAGKDPDFGKRYNEALLDWRLGGLEAMRRRCLAILDDASSSADHLELALKWLAANSDPAVFRDPDVVEIWEQAEAKAVAKTRPVDRPKLPHLMVQSEGKKAAPSPAPTITDPLAEIMQYADAKA